MRGIGRICSILLLVLACDPVSGFKPFCDCADMGGQWVTSRQLFDENGQLSSPSMDINMAIQMTECGAQGTIGEGGKIYRAYFPSGQATYLSGKWSLNEEEGTFSVQLKDKEKDCASFEGYMMSGDKHWRWTGYKSPKAETASVPPASLLPPDSTSSTPPEPKPTSDSTGGILMQITTSQGEKKIVEWGKKTDLLLRSGDNGANVEAICNEIGKRINILNFWLVNAPNVFSDSTAAVNLMVKYKDIFSKLCTISEDPFGPFLEPNYDIASTSAAADSSLELTLELQHGPIKAEVTHDRVALDISTPTVIVSSQGINSFVVAHNQESGKSYVAAYQYPIQVQPVYGSPFILESGQEVEIDNAHVTPISPISTGIPGDESDPNQNPNSAPEVSEGGCYADPITGEIVCVDSTGNPSEPKSGMSGGCYADPVTGEIVCIDSYGDSNQEGKQVEEIQGEESQKEGTQDLCFEDPDTGEIICSDTEGEYSNPQGGCYQDPATGKYVCIN